MKIAVAGKKSAAENYVRSVSSVGLQPVVTLNLGEIAACDALLLPGGGDITPAFFGERNRGSRNIDTELDILQFQALDLCIRERKPILGICKGMQLINVGLGGTVVQDLYTAELHQYRNGDRMHPTSIEKNSWLHRLYGNSLTVNSAHHQAVKKLGAGLKIIQYCREDGCPEGLAHESLPIIGVQWHPERLVSSSPAFSGEPVLSYFASLIPLSRQ